MNKRVIGTCYEQIALDYLKKNNVQILEVNYRCRVGEIDIIGRQEEYLIFFEVKFRSSMIYGYPEEAVHFYKRRNICKVAKYYCYRHGISLQSPMRFDIVAILDNEITWYQNAFYEQ